ncbi:hypothetical protein, partial [Halocola ammonii]
MSVIEVENGYVSTGFLGDSISNNRPMIFAKFDYEGNLLFQEVHGSGGSEYFSSQNPDLFFYNDTVLIHSGVSGELGYPTKAYIAKFNLEGDTLNLLRYYSPNPDPEYSFYSTLKVTPSSSGNMFLLANFSQAITQGDFIIRKIAQTGEIIWEYEYVTDQDPDYCRVNIPTDDGGVIAIAKIGVSGEEPNYHHIFKLDVDGELDWEYES